MRDAGHAYRWNAGILAGTGATYETRISQGGAVQVSPRTAGGPMRPPLAPTRGAPLTLETVSISRGPRVLASGAAPATLEPDGTVIVRRGPITERLENDDAGLEQSWQLDRSPEGEGDLVVSVRGVGQRYAARTEHGLHFAGDGSSSLGLRYGAATWVDASGRRSPVEPRWVEGAIVLTVPASVLASSTFPAVLDPTVSAETEIDKPAGGAQAAAEGEQTGPSVASAGAGKGFFAAWLDYRGARPAMYGARIDTNGNVVDTTGIPIAMGVANATPVVVARSDGGGYLVIWAVSYVDTYQEPGIYAVRLDAQGRTLDTTPITVAANVSNSNGPTAAFDGTNWFVVWSHYSGGTTGYDVAGALVPGTGPVATPAVVDVAKTTDFEYAPTIGFGGGQYMVAWRTSTKILAQSFDKTGAHVGTPSQVSTLLNVYSLTSAFDGTNHLVVFSGYSGASTHIWARRVSTAASVLDAADRVVVADPVTYDDYPHAAFDGTDTLISWSRSGNLMAARMTTAGVMRDAPVEVTASFNTAAPPYYPNYSFYDCPMASDGNGAIAVSTQYGGPVFSNDVIGVHIPKAPVGPQAATLVTKAAPQETSPAVAHSAKAHYVTWLDGRGASPGIWGATLGNDAAPGTATKLVDDAVRFPDLAQPRIASDGTGYLVVFYASEPPQSRRGIFGIRVDGSGTPDATGAFPIWTTSTVTPPFETDGAPDVSFDGANYLVVWQAQTTDGSGILGVRLPKASNTPIETQPAHLSNINTIETRDSPSVAFDGQNHFLAWVTRRPTPGGVPVSHIYGTRVSKEAAPLDAEIVICNAFLLQRAPAVAGDAANGGFLAVWEDYRTDLFAADVYGARIDAQGRLEDGDTGFKIAAGPQDESRPHVAPSGDGTNWVVAWRDLRSKATYDIYGAWVSLAGRNHDPNGYLLSAESGDEDLPRLDSSGAGKLVLAYQRLDPANGYGSYRIRARSIDSGALVGSTCTKGDDCASRSCVDGFCCSTECDGCGVCNRTPGTCTARAAGDVSPTCPTYKCTGDLACPTQCMKDDDCAQNASCDPATHTCISRIICTDEHTLKDLSGNLKDCAPYKCVGDACKTQCGSVDDCASGFVCTPDGRCVQSPGPSDAGGCTASGASPSDGGAGVLLAGITWIAAGIVGRRARARRRVV
jgi:hypothetical protein